MSYVALYRAWRPQRFADVIGQEHVVTTLTHALQMNRLAHAYLFAGPRGTGKTSLAKILAKAVNCEHPQGVEPCNVCPACTGITAGAVMDVIEMDAASNRGIDEIRSLLEQVRYAPTEVQKKVYIIDEVHMLTPEAFNALLKTLEEPPDYCLFILATTELHKVPPTVASRCQRFTFGRVKIERVVDRLREVVATLPVEIEDAALWLIARLTEGGLRDALALLDQVVAFSDLQVGVEQVAQVTGGVASEKIGQLCTHVFTRDYAALLSLLASFWEQGVDPSQLVVEISSYLRDAILQRCGGVEEKSGDRSAYDPTFPIVIQRVTPEILLTFAQRMGSLQSELRYQAQTRLYVEVSLVSFINEIQAQQKAGQLVQAEVLQELQQEVSQLTKRIEAFEQRHENLRKERSSPITSEEVRTPFTEGKTPDYMAQADFAPASEVRVSPIHPQKVAMRGIEPWRGKKMSQNDQDRLAAIEQKWNLVLEEVKKVSIQSRAWLLAGRPVAVFGEHLVVAFKSSLHAETVMRSPHREFIEEVLQRLFQCTLSIATILEDKWGQLQQEHPLDTEPIQSKGREPWVEKVIELLGEDRVQIVIEE
ncbi:DNA polymerase III subunit gamma/tau [Sulfoacidibacillus thermotolerans]|uniref:DNA-directed DNA polymerase n=1 Tax=Sulfoacidibacillus thermotolerans TaxID=1765684 RepID=A0A2U3D8D1_SULT2|nr:DNA polymerase III subunit gamma/tau [Sulfoacidibacillus thermotolerans]PWI57537.1 hypothetical protein BM613_07870 [Sulfoacidibacillus thermotolerans]